MSTTTAQPDMQVLTAIQSADTWTGWPTYDVYSDELGFLANYTALDAEDAIEQAMEDLL